MQTHLFPADRRLRIYGMALRIAVATLGLLTFLLFSSVIVSLVAQERRVVERPGEKAKPIGLKSVSPDLVPPAMKEAEPAPGKRVKQQLPGYENTNVYHALYLPTNWTKDQRWPVLVEYPGNGPYENALGDKNSGFVEDCNLAFGISSGKDFICLTLPFVNLETKSNQRQWWGDAQTTVDYCLAAVDLICEKFGGDRERLVLCGFSRGAIACNYIGLRNDKIAKLWKCFIVHSHYDGVRKWPYADSDAASARERLARLSGRAQWISHEGNVSATEQFLADAAKTSDQPLGQFTFVALPFPNHTDTWVLCDIEPRRQLLAWLGDQLAVK